MWDRMSLRLKGRVAFGALWIVGQVALVVSADDRPDHIFGFRMFPEASTLEIELLRVTARGDVPAPHGEWSAQDGSGQLRHFSWHDRVRDPVLGTLDTPVFASYGLDAQFARLQHALDDVADHLQGDAETLQLQADVSASKNGREPTTVILSSRLRSAR
jgi:hypothetical protein